MDGDAVTGTGGLEIFEPGGNVRVTGCATSVASRVEWGGRDWWYWGKESQ